MATLRSAYRETTAPPWLAERVAANLPQQTRRWSWMAPALATAAAVVLAIIAVRPGQDPVDEMRVAMKTPSLSALKPDDLRPDRVKTPDLKRLRGLPVLPRSPKPPGGKREPEQRG